MATCSNIGIEYNDGSVKMIYCHWDGYASNNGRILLNHYKNKEKIESLLSLGDISLLEMDVEPNPKFVHRFDNAQPTVTVAYHRDRGEKLSPALIFESKESASKNMQEYLYLFSEKENKWYMKSYDYDFVELTEQIIRKDK